MVSTVEPICLPRYRGDNNVHLFGNVTILLLLLLVVVVVVVVVVHY
jgi:hypothetical protein